MRTRLFSHSLKIALVLSACLCAPGSTAMAALQESVKGVILKITDSGTSSGNVIPEPLTSNPVSVVNKLNFENVGEVRVQVNDGLDNDAVTTSGADSVNTLASLGFSGQAILDNKKWDLHLESKQDDWVDRMYDTYQKMDAAGKSLVGGYSFGETTPTVLTWDNYSTGVVAAIGKLNDRFLTDADPTNDEALAGMKVFVGGAGFGGTFKNLTAFQHASMNSAIESVGATMIYSYKSFHSNQGLPQPGPNDETTVAASQNWLNNEVGLAHLAAIASDTQVKYRGDASDKITNNSNRRQALINIFNEHDNFLHAGAEKVINATGTGGDLFEDNGSPRSGNWSTLNSFFSAIQQPADPRDGIAASVTSAFNINTNADNRPFFDAGGTSGYVGSVGPGVSANSLVTRERVTIVGSATAAAAFQDGNGVPEGVAVSFDMSFNVSTPTGTLTDGGNNGLGVDTGNGSANQLDAGEQLHFSSIALSNVVFRDPRNLIVDGTESINAAWSVLRSNDFGEANDGAVVSSDAAGLQDATGFGLAGPNAIDNDFNTGTFEPLEEVFITITDGAWRLKGIGYEIDLDFELNIDGNADFDENGSVDGSDFLTLQRGYGNPGSLAHGDADYTGFVDGDDLAIWQSQFGTSYTVQALTVVPEPRSLALGVAMAVFISGLRIGRRNHLFKFRANN